MRLLITSRYIAMQSYECVIISKMFLNYFISYGCNGGVLVFLGGAEASASPSFALPMFITIKKTIILHLFLGVATPLAQNCQCMTSKYCGLLRLNQILKQSRGFQANEAESIISHVLLAKRIKLRYSASM